MTDEQKIEIWVAGMMKNNPIKLAQWALFIIGKDIAKSNATEFSLSQEFDLEKGDRYEITIKGNIKKI